MRKIFSMLFVCLLGFLFLSQPSNALQLRYDGYDYKGEPLSSILKITDFKSINDLSLFLEFENYGGLPMASTSGSVSIYSIIIPFLESKLDCYGVYSHPYLYVFADQVSNLMGTIATTSMILELKFDGQHFVLERNFTKIYMQGSTSQSQGNTWIITTPSEYVGFYLTE